MPDADTPPPGGSGDGAGDGRLPWRERRRHPVAGFLSPAVRRLAAEHEIDLATVRGTGAGGRITRGDVLAVAGGAAAVSAPPEGVAAFGARGDEVVPFSRVRTRAAAALLESKRTAAHALVIAEADYTAVEAARRAIRARFRAEEGFSLTYLPFVARAVCAALREFPRLNARVDADALVVSRGVHLGIAVDLERQGLVVPVVRDADGRSLRGVARAIDDVATRARSKRLVPDDLAGGTFTITNPGSWGTWMSFPVIHRPAAAILSTDGVAKRVVADPATGALTIRPRGHLCMTFDHRALDGAYAGAFLRRVCEVLAGRDWAAEVL